MNKKIILGISIFILLPLPILIFFLATKTSSKKSICLQKDLLLIEKRFCRQSFNPLGMVIGNSPFDNLATMAEDFTIAAIYKKAKTPSILFLGDSSSLIYTKLPLVASKNERLNMEQFKRNHEIPPSDLRASISYAIQKCLDSEGPSVLAYYPQGSRFSIDRIVGLPSGELLIQLKDSTRRLIEINENDFKVILLGCEHVASHRCKSINPIKTNKVSAILDLELIGKVSKVYVTDAIEIGNALNKTLKEFGISRPDVKVSNSRFDDEEKKFAEISGGIKQLQILQACGLIINQTQVNYSFTPLENEWINLLIKLHQDNSMLLSLKPTREELRVAEQFVLKNPKVFGF